MTLDERLNKLEDQIRSLKETINHNNQVARQAKQALETKIASLQNQIVEMGKPRNEAFTDLFGADLVIFDSEERGYRFDFSGF